MFQSVLRRLLDATQEEFIVAVESGLLGAQIKLNANR